MTLKQLINELQHCSEVLGEDSKVEVVKLFIGNAKLDKELEIVNVIPETYPSPGKIIIEVLEEEFNINTTTVNVKLTEQEKEKIEELKKL